MTIPSSPLRQIWFDLRSSFWFTPGLIILASIGAAFGLIELDARMDPAFPDRYPLLFGAGAAGSRGLLSSIAGSMITVAGVVFSITLVALSLASNQYTSRVLNNFMNDRLNQAVLGVFLGIFVYCLIVIRTIREGEEGTFVPSISVFAGMVFGLAGIGFLVLFIHHISVSIQASQIIADITEETLESIDHLFQPADHDEDDELKSRIEDLPQQGWRVVNAAGTGYLQQVDSAALLQLAVERKMLIRMEKSVGDFVIRETPVACVHFEDDPDEKALGEIGSGYSVGRRRTVEQDAEFGIRQLVDIALKALSPGINDTTTAIMCIHYLTAIGVSLAGRRISQRFREKNGRLRVIIKGPTFASLTGKCFDQILENSGGNQAVLKSLLDGLGTIGEQTSSGSRRRVLLSKVGGVIEQARRTIPGADALRQIEERSRQVVAALTL